ncbi:MAG TPA: LacI family DNA-binding transcriptional regulator [Bryobacteraceae bacterium]|nr:LacI family DNA-binding transcriptional regulator [Bryobacteraceae bacterium]
MPTIKEVAHRARVSVGTVSNVISGSVPVSKRLKDRVLEVIKQLDYHPDHVARSLKIRQTRTIGLVISDMTDPFFPQVMRGAEDAAWGANYILITLNSDDQPEREQQGLDALRSRRVDGILLAGAMSADPARIRAIQSSGTPIVCLDREIAGAGVDCVVVNNFHGAQQCTLHLAGNGHRQIAFLDSGVLDSDLALSPASERLAGYRQGLQDAGLAHDQSLEITAGSRPEDALYAVRKLLATCPRPFAAIAGSIRLGVALLRGIRETGLRCPQDVALAIFDDPVFSEAVDPPLTAIAQPAYELGRKGVELLLRRMQEPQCPPTKLVLETTLRIRESTAALLAPVAHAV